MARPQRETDEPAEGETEATRRCLVTGDIRLKAALIRFVVSPDGHIVPDIASRLPGRGLWLTARRDIVAQATAKRAFGRAARRPVVVADGLPDQIEGLLAARCRDLIGLARRAGAAQMGFAKVAKLLASGTAGLLLGAGDGARDGRDKVRAMAPALAERSELSAAELGAAFGRDHVVHAALRAGRLAAALAGELDRLDGFRPGFADAARRVSGNQLTVLERE